jgi:NAD(P)-dependent dehydrogenase (short-subunit alcohol dehydrogenase family)
VTGAAKGIGAAIASRLAEAGAHVTLADVDAAGAETADAIASHGRSAEFVRCDITSTDDVRAAVSAASQEGALDILVNNAGIFPTTGPLANVSDEFVHTMLDVNVRAQYSVTREASSAMTSGGCVVNLASIAGLRGGANISAYATSKAAVIGMTHAFAAELGARGIRVNAIAPGVIDTPGVQDQLSPLRAAGVNIDAAISANPLRTVGQPDHVARAALFLVSDLAAFVNGAVLVVDGGATA